MPRVAPPDEAMVLQPHQASGELVGLKESKIFKAFSERNEFHGDAERLLNAVDNATLGSSVYLG